MAGRTSRGELTLVAGEAAARTLGARGRDLAHVVAERYRLVQHLGAGTSKDVFQAWDERLRRDVAVAIVAGVDGDARTRVLREVETTAQLDHPHIVTVHDCGEEQQSIYIVSQLVRGGSAADWSARAEPGEARVRTAVELTRQIASALGHAHAAHVVHRDIKPANVLLAHDGMALLTDFGVALLIDRPRLTSAGGIVGSAAYIAPEQVTGGDVDERSDVYSLGATLYEMVCGRPPFPGDAFTVMMQHVRKRPPDPRELEPAVPPALAGLILRMLAKEPANRPASAAEVEDELAPLAAGAAQPAHASEERLPAPLEAGARRPFVGRDAARDALRGAWAQALGGRPRLALVSGEAGIGKTRLAEAFAEEAHRDGALVLFGRCDEDPLGSYQPFVEALRELMAEHPELVHALDPRLEPELGELARLVPELRAEFPAEPGTGEPERYLVFGGVVAVLAAATTQRRMLLVLDDVQWADRSTALLLRHVLRSTTESGILVLGTMRTGDAGTPDPLLDVCADLRRDSRRPGRLVTVALDGLVEAETAELISARVHRSVDNEFVRELRETTSGNPFFIEEMLRDGELSAGAPAGRRLPAAVTEAIQGRLRRLHPDTVTLLTRAAVCGREFRLDVLGEALGAPASRLVGPLEDAMAAGLVLEPAIGRFTFRHALVRETLYAGIGSKSTRARLHLAVGEALERLDGDDVPASKLAQHFFAARHVGGAERAARYAEAAARAAASVAAYEEAAAHETRLRKALALLGPARLADRFRVLSSLGHRKWQIGDHRAAQATFLHMAALARRHGDAEQLANAALGLGGRWYDAEHTDPALVGLLEEALATLPPGDGPLRVKLLARLAEARRPADDEGAAALNRDALDMAFRVGDDDALIHALAGRHAALLPDADPAERLAVSERWVALAGAGGNREPLALGLSWRIHDLFEVGDAAGARAAHGRLGELAASLRQALYLNFAASWDVKWLEAAGRFAEAEERAREARRWSEKAQTSYGTSLFAGQIFGLRRDQGRLEEVLPMVERLMGGDPTLSAWRGGMLLARIQAGDPERAQAELSALAERGFAAIRRDLFWLPAVCMLAEAAALLGDDTAAAALHAELAPHAARNAQVGLAFFLGPVDLFLGQLAATLGRTREAERRFSGAVRRSGALGARTAEVRAHCGYGELLLARGDDGARARLAHAAAEARDLGMDAIARRAEEGLDRAG